MLARLTQIKHSRSHPLARLRERAGVRTVCARAPPHPDPLPAGEREYQGKEKLNQT